MNSKSFRQYTIFYYCMMIMLITSNESHGQWIQVANPPSDILAHHTFGFALDGQGYLVTGSTLSENTAAFYRFDPQTEEYTKLPDFPGGARSFAIGDTWDGKAYLGFGSNEIQGILNDLWVFEPTTEQWTQLTSCPCEPRRHPALVLQEVSCCYPKTS